MMNDKDSLTEKAALLVELTKKQRELRLQLDAINERIISHREDLLHVTQDLDVLTLKTGNYTIARAIRITPTIEDFGALKKSLEEQGIPVLLEEVFAPQMDTVFKEAVKQGRELKGLGKKETQYVSVRIAKGVSTT